MLRRNSAWPGASISTMSRDGGAEADLAGVERDALVALGLQRIEQERPFERHAAPLADGLERFELAVRQAAGFVQQPADQRRLAVIDMPDDDDADQRTAAAGASGAGRDGIFGDEDVHGAHASRLTVTDSRRCAAARTRPRTRDPSRGPARSGVLVASSSAMISSMVRACEATGNVMSAVAERAIALAVACEIERDDRDAFAPRVGPDVDLGPMQDRMDAQMRARRRRGVELVPELRRLVAHVPSAFETARREHALLRARRLLVAADAGDQAVELVLGERELQAFGLARRGAGGGRQRRIDGLDRRAVFDDEVEVPLAPRSDRGTRTSREISCRYRRA